MSDALIVCSGLSCAGLSFRGLSFGGLSFGVGGGRTGLIAPNVAVSHDERFVEQTGAAPPGGRLLEAGGSAGE
ncbi:hypothetical protein [Streptosporangium carneum]|nr:hypothetical protein [Streptosporangium carneum]